MKITGYQPQSDLEKSASRDALEQNKHTTDNTDKDGSSLEEARNIFKQKRAL